MSDLFESKILKHIEKSRIIAVLVIDRIEDAVPLACALMDGGIDVMELTLRTPVAINALRRIREEVPEMLVGAGTIITVDQVRLVADAGAAFGVAPGMNLRIVKKAQEIGLPFAPGIITPSDIEHALECGYRLLKFFPAEASGGLPYLKSMASPYTYLNLRFIPLGGIDISNLRDYLEDSIITAVGGSWIAPRRLIQKRDWKIITKNAREARQIANEIKGKNV